ncbi:uncharacterized protein [Asterias amurensis]|uniref:uncharacterized protein n=1 Tax=Asterias amurensis TaxID=7602 RepID=UPI003AB33460
MTSSHIFKTLLVCSVSVCMAATCSDGNIQLHQPGCNQGQHHQRATARNHALQAPIKLVHSLMGDRWFNDLWNDPFDWGQRSPLLSFSSSTPCGSGLSTVSPSSLVRRRKDEVSSKQMECHGCQKDVPKEELNTWAAEEEQLYIKEANLRKERENLERRKLEADKDRKEQQRRETIQNEQYQRAVERQLGQQRLEQQQVVRLQRLKEQQAEHLRRQIEERRLQEEKLREQLRQEAELQKQREEQRRLQQRQEAEELQRQRREEQRWKEERLREEREVYERRMRHQQEQRQAQEEQLATERQQKWRQRQSHQGTNSHNRHHQRNNFKKTEISSLQIPGYWPEDVSAVMTSENRLRIQGKHICSCHEKCTEREFQRSVSIPGNIDPLSIEATLNKDGKLTISGGTRQNMAGGRVTEDLVVAVQSDGSFTPRSRNLDSSCGGARKGFKLKKMNKRTGEIFEDFEDYTKMDDRTFEDEIDEDGVTMEVMDF